MGGEDVEDQSGAVDDLHPHAVLEVTQLRGFQLAVADHGVGAGREHHLTYLVHLPAADERGWVGVAAPLHQGFQHLRTGGLGEQLEFGHGVVGIHLAADAPDAHQNHPLQLQLAVLDLGDVGELGGHARHPTEGVAVGEILGFLGQLC